MPLPQQASECLHLMLKPEDQHQPFLLLVSKVNGASKYPKPPIIPFPHHIPKGMEKLSMKRSVRYLTHSIQEGDFSPKFTVMDCWRQLEKATNEQKCCFAKHFL